jgi:thymidylate synthase
MFRTALTEENFTVDKTGAKTIEIIGASFLADEETIFGTVNQEYVQQELKWYDSMSTNVNDIREGDAPAAWQYTANKYGEINSNYGLLIHSDQYHNQYLNALNELKSNSDTRRASMVYQRPSIWVDFNANGKNDFICTNAVTYYKRDGKLNAVVQMRSNDAVFGYKNDYAWQSDVLHSLIGNLDDGTEYGDIYWQVQNMHVYERHFGLIK